MLARSEQKPLVSGTAGVRTAGLRSVFGYPDTTGTAGVEEPLEGPLVSDLFSVTLTPAVPAYLARVGPTTRMLLA